MNLLAMLEIKNTGGLSARALVDAEDEWSHRSLKDTRYVPFLIACTSFCALSLHLLVAWFWPKLANPTYVNDLTPGPWFKSFRSPRSPVVCYLLARVLGCIVLSVASIYALSIAFASLSYGHWRSILTRHVSVVLLGALGAFGHCNLWPLATYGGGQPRDVYKGNFLWVELVILVCVAVVIPLSVSRLYIPVDAKDDVDLEQNPMPDPNPEQTASIFSMMTFSFIDPIISLAYCVPHIRPDQLPPLADYDSSRYLSMNASHLDPLRNEGGKRKSLFFGLLWVFRETYFNMFAIIIFQVGFGFASPIGMNRILHYLETKGEGAIMRPWFWILWLFLGPTLKALSTQRYTFLSSRTVVRAQSILIQLVFEHSLRIHLEAGSVEHPADPRSITTGPVNPNHLRPTKPFAAATPTTSSNGSGNVNSDLETEALKKHNANLTGKINNLVTSDVNNICRSTDFPQLGNDQYYWRTHNEAECLSTVFFAPLQIAGCIIFLYALLGWSVFIGIAVAVMLIPLPGYVANMVREIQVQKMRKVDTRIQAVVEVVSALRMIKLFGWETQMSSKIESRRSEELQLLWKQKVLDVTIMILKAFSFTIPTITMLVTYAVYTVIGKGELNEFSLNEYPGTLPHLSKRVQRAGECAGAQRAHPAHFMVPLGPLGVLPTFYPSAIASLGVSCRWRSVIPRHQDSSASALSGSLGVGTAWHQQSGPSAHLMTPIGSSTMRLGVSNDSI
ncbi:ABC transporter type 1, transmembrane domain-containing protein [Crassisporium funariophilum]|nr:ABC transporter type 1, transmembrane domain-containing protein [Crassisporium funariophilum]